MKKLFGEQRACNSSFYSGPDEMGGVRKRRMDQNVGNI